ncbi:CehA/McbA family metallohydrolase [Nocardioides mangrovi]|uniref:CehA/McbA family metallohydrolase n=1 Tax=Nocardioides mangrovi TaxID=2874580 RepID=A0ABS7UA34_9ACTN|nr:CehA/McbA family metallohydrolase [Nocardioides mangrovi]MBZ5737730.1 CehA/McbA family metallohydrolase [Nocardioides mangrovi]
MQHLDRRSLLLSGAGVATTAALMSFAPAAAGATSTQVFKGHFDPGNARDWVYLPIEVPKGIRSIEVSYTHDPPHDTGLGYSQNVIDLGVFDPQGFRGWSGGARDRFKISRSSATPGYLAGPVRPGTWRVALGPYQIVSRTKYAVTVRLHHGDPAPKFHPQIAPTSTGLGTGWYRGDLHVHTVHSDGGQTQQDVLDYARAAGLDFIGSSEHNTSSAPLTWGRYVGDLDDFLVIPGEEVTTRYGHWLAMGMPAGTWIDWRYAPQPKKDNKALAKATAQVRAAGGLAIAAHPYIPVPSIRWDFGTDFEHMDAVEVWNGPWDTYDNKAVAEWHKLLVAGRRIPAVGNSDSHQQSQQIGLAQTVVRAESLAVTDLVAGYRGGHSWITGSADVDIPEFTATLDDVSGQCGDTVPSGPDDEVTVRLTVTGVSGATASLIGPTSTLARAAAVDGTITLETQVPGGTAFVRVEVRGGSTSTSPMLALTNPIYLTAVTSAA